jgi:hypothetical protein
MLAKASARSSKSVIFWLKLRLLWGQNEKEHHASRLDQIGAALAALSRCLIVTSETA